MKLYLIRHGETDWNIERRLQGQVDIELNEFGRTLAVKTGKGLENIQFDICFTSPLKRARETAELILAGKVKVNHFEQTHYNKMLSLGDMVSISKKGRFVLEEIEGITRKDRIRITIKKYE